MCNICLFEYFGNLDIDFKRYISIFNNHKFVNLKSKFRALY